ncbi:methylation-associated defense system protein MAD7 [Herpetosiphon llansteffanensis]|uniref:methylation-associated defense system protein MAD7 n=1 Tax=Herpetosiphon llansteffanensis TaxID=2094568 RepID=UPI0013DF258F|nr:hypothetical protein [Herpetosiphon llansteffanensis]
MKVKIPKDLVGVSFSKVMTIELNDFNTDIFLPSLFFKIMSGGKSRSKVKNKEEIIFYINEFSNKIETKTYEKREKNIILEKLVRTSLIATSKVGRNKRGEQIMAILPYSLLCYKPGFPIESRRQRGVDSFIYQILCKEIQLGHDYIKKQIIEIFGKGIIFGNVPGTTNAAYDGKTDLDTLTTLSMVFADGFEATGFGRENDKNEYSPCVGLTNIVAKDIWMFLHTYAERMPNQALTYYFQALVSFEMYLYSLRLAYAINQLVYDPSILPSAMNDPIIEQKPLIYVDFIGKQNHLSHRMSSECVRRDVEIFQHFFRSMVELRWLDKQIGILKKSASGKIRINQILHDNPQGAIYLQRILLMRDDPELKFHLDAAARHAIGTIREATIPLAEEDDTEDSDLFEEIIESGKTDIQQLVLLLEEGQRQNVLSNYMGWIVGAGGMNKTYGLLSGIQRQRRTWHYAPSNDLLSLLVQLATMHAMPIEDRGQNKLPPSIRLQEFLKFLEQRYGIIIDRPPLEMHGVEYHAAARENLQAMLKRLRQMGIFTDLSDDFTVQRLYSPYSNNVDKE